MSSGATGTSTASSRPARTAASSPAHSTSSSRVSGYSRPRGVPVAGVVGPTDALEERRDRAGRADLAHQLHRADVDAQARATPWPPTPAARRPAAALDPQATVLRQAAVVRRDHVVAEPLAQLVGQPLGQPAGVDEHDASCGGRPRARRSGRARCPSAPADAIASSSPSGSSIATSSARRCPVSTIVQLGAPSAAVRAPTSSARHHLDRLLRRRQTDPRRRDRADVGEALERERTGGCPACRGPGRGSRRRSRCRRCAASPGSAPR